MGLPRKLYDRKWLDDDERGIPENQEHLEYLEFVIDPERYADTDLPRNVKGWMLESLRQYTLDRPDARSSQREEEARIAAHQSRVMENSFGRHFAHSKLLLDAEIPGVAPDSSRVKRGALRSETAAEAMGL